jgi:capreomycidine synthase
MNMQMPPALLEEWMRDYYFATEIDIGSSGVEDFSLAEIRRLLGLEWEDLDRIVFHDSQTLGGSGLRQAIADRWAGGDVRRAMATHGSSEANYLLMNALLMPGDEVLVADPCYPQLFTIAEARGCRMKTWPVRFENGYRPDLDELERLLGPQTRMVVVNFPQNPTGASLDPEEQRRLVEIVDRSGAWLVWDNAFGEITYDRPPLPDPTSFSDRAISMGTLSKCFGLPGLRVGWCIAAPSVLERCIRWRDYITLHLSPLVETIAAAAISQAELLIAPRREQAQRNLDILRAWLGENEEDIRWVPPRGGVCVFPRLPEMDVEAFCHRLAREKKVLLVPGNCFGHPQHVRLGFGGSAAGLQEGLGRLGELLATWRPEV